MVFVFKQKTAYEMRISDWSSDVCSSDLVEHADAAGLHDDVGLGGLVHHALQRVRRRGIDHHARPVGRVDVTMLLPVEGIRFIECDAMAMPGKLLQYPAIIGGCAVPVGGKQAGRSEEHTSELQSLMRNS